jgi:hypothetical protein
MTPAVLPAGRREDEQCHEGDVDEEGGIDQAHGQQEGCVETALRLGLTGDSSDELCPGQAVADAGVDGSASQGDRSNLPAGRCS